MRIFNHYHPTQCRLWFSYSLGLELRACKVPAVGTPPDWLTLEREQVGTDWEDLLCLPHSYNFHEFPESAGWLLRHGLAPGQRFRIALYPPEHTETWTDCGTEYDTEYSAELIGWQSMPAAVAARMWEQMLWVHAEDQAVQAQEKALREEQQRRRMALALADPSALYLTSEPYHTRRDSWDYMPSGLLIRLQSSYLMGYYSGLCEGRSESGSREEAMGALLAAAAFKLPHVRPEYIRALPYNRPHVDRSAEARGER